MVSKLLHCANALACVLLPSLVQGQGNIIIVDAANGGGTHFLDIPPAVAAAQPGDTIRVRAGTYNGFTLNIGISVVAEGNVFFGGLFQWPTINVAGVPAGQVAAIRGLSLASSQLNTVLTISDCIGQVIVEDFGAALAAVLGISRPAISVANCAHVQFNGCRVAGFPGLFVANSTVAASQCEFAGGRTVFESGGSAVQATAASVTLSRCTLRGSNSNALNGGGPALVSNGALWIITAEANSVIAAGSGPRPVSAITGDGTMRLHPDIVLVPTGGAPPISGPIQVTR